MPDADRTSLPPPPASWGDAFAALPLEAPDRDALPRVLARLPHEAAMRRRRIARRFGGAVLAASVLVALVIAWPRTSTQDAAPLQVARHDEPAPTAPSTAATPPNVATPSPAIDTVVAQDKPAPAASEPRRTPRAKPKRALLRTEPERAVAAVEPAATQTPAATSTSTDDALVRLQQEGAQLEALVAAVRDDRVTSAPAAVMASQLDGRIALIDVALSDSQLAETERLQLWQQRVSALRELAGLETTQRWLAANGESYDGALVSLD